MTAPDQVGVGGLDTLSGGGGTALVIAKAAGTLVALVGLVVLFGWALDIPALKSIHPRFVAMKANTATEFLLGGVGLLLHAQARGHAGVAPVGRVCGIAVALVGLLTLIEYIFTWNLGIDELLFHEPAGAVGTSHPGRMAPNTALAFVLVGGGLVGGKSKQARRFCEGALIIAVLFAITAVVGYADGVTSFYGFAAYTRMAPHTAGVLAILSIGTLCVHPDRGLVGLLSGDGAGSQVGRRLLPAAILVPIVLGWLRLQGERAGLYGGDFGVSLFVMATIVLLSAATLWNVSSLEAADHDRKKADVARQTYADVARNMPVGLIVWRLSKLDDARTFTLMAFNPAGERFLGFPLATRIGEAMTEIFPG